MGFQHLSNPVEAVFVSRELHRGGRPVVINRGVDGELQLRQRIQELLQAARLHGNRDGDQSSVGSRKRKTCWNGN